MNASTSIQNNILNETQDRVPVIVIVGRPNVGKSTLFNRLIGKRKAITDHTPGVTRDPVREYYYLDDNCFQLIDTGGIQNDREEIAGQVTERSLNIIKQADLILFLLDVTAYTPADETLVEYLRPYSDKVAVVVNKVDNPKREIDVWNYHAIGFAPVFSISSAHGLGIDTMEDFILERLGQAECPKHPEYSDNDNRGIEKGDTDQVIEELQTDEVMQTSRTDQQDNAYQEINVAILGKPNTGKSTLVNSLTGVETSIVSSIPGTTRDVVEGSFVYRQTLYRLLDTAGIRRKGKVLNQVEYYSVNRAIHSIDEADVVVLMVSGLENVTDQDKKIASQVVKRGKGIILTLSKWDLLEQTTNLTQAMKDRVNFLFPVLHFAPIVPLSAVTGEGMEPLLSAIYQVYKQLNRRIGTPQLNGYIAKWMQQNEPPRVKRSRFKIFYGVQNRNKPLEFLFFVNHKKHFPEFYLSYLKNCIRRDLGFSAVPISIILKER